MTTGRIVTLRKPAHSPQDGASHRLYLQVQATLQEMIEDVEYGPGDQIPSERELSAMLGVSRMTVRRAVENLIQLGMLERRSTSGTYVRIPEVVRRVSGQNIQGLTQLLEEAGNEAGAKLLHFQLIRGPRKVANRLGLRIGEQVVMVRRLRLVNGQPFCIETSYMPSKYVPGLALEDLQTSTSLYDLLKERYGITLADTDRELKLSRCLPDEAELLGLGVGDPVLFMKLQVWDTEGRCIEYVKSMNHPDRVTFKFSRKL